MYQHTQLADGKWQQLSLVEQMANIGSEVFRAIKWREKSNENYSHSACNRALELLSLSIDDPKNRSGLKELTRNYEFIVDFFLGDNIYQSTNQQFEKYFLSFNFAARATT